MKPVFDYFILKPTTERTTKSGLIIHSNETSSDELEGLVVDVGPGKRVVGGNNIAFTGMIVNPGDRVKVLKKNARKLEDGLYLLSESDILLIL